MVIKLAKGSLWRQIGDTGEVRVFFNSSSAVSCITAGKTGDCRLVGDVFLLLLRFLLVLFPSGVDHGVLLVFNPVLSIL